MHNQYIKKTINENTLLCINVRFSSQVIFIYKEHLKGIKCPPKC